MRIRNEQEARANLREIRRLNEKLHGLHGGVGRNEGATIAAYDRRVAADRAYYVGAGR